MPRQRIHISLLPCQLPGVCPALQESDFSNILPIMEDGIKPTARLWRLMAGGEIIVSMLLPYVEIPDKAETAYW